MLPYDLHLGLIIAVEAAMLIRGYSEYVGDCSMQDLSVAESCFRYTFILHLALTCCKEHASYRFSDRRRAAYSAGSR